MRLHGSLLWWQYRQILPITLLAAVGLALYVFFHGEPLRFQAFSVPAMIVLLHCAAIAWGLGRVRSTAFGYLHVQGYSRSALWGCTMLASVASILTAWLPMTAIIWLPLRSLFQDAVMLSPYFVAMGSPERPFTLWVLVTYACLIPVFHYAWIRGSLPRKGGASGLVLALATVIALFSYWVAAPNWHRSGWPCLAVTGVFLLSSLILLLASRHVYARMEVRR